jgi:hypothetical protein
MASGRHSEGEAPEDRYTRWYLRVRDSTWWRWAAPLLKHPWGIAMAMGVFAVVVLAAAVSWWLLVPAADWLARHDVGSAKGALLQTARDAARGRLLTLGAGLFAAGVLVYTARNFRLSREAQVTDRYTKAITQLGDDKLDVRIGGIYALERVARDSNRDHPAVMEVLAAFIREHSPKLPPLDPRSGEHRQPIPPDVQAALTVIGHRFITRDIRPMDLTGADLTGARWSGAAPAPTGWELDTGTGLLVAAGGDPAPPKAH